MGEGDPEADGFVGMVRVYRNRVGVLRATMFARNLFYE